MSSPFVLKILHVFYLRRVYKNMGKLAVVTKVELEYNINIFGREF